MAGALIAFNENENELIAVDDGAVPLFGVECMSNNELFGMPTLGDDWTSGDDILIALTGSTVFCGAIDVVSWPAIDDGDWATLATGEPNGAGAGNLTVRSLACTVPDILLGCPNTEFDGFDFSAVRSAPAGFDSLATLNASACMAGIVVGAALGADVAELKLNGF